jgi:hypothetical protein
MRNEYRILVWKPQRHILLGRSRSRLQDTLEMCTLPSILTFVRRSSRHITYDIVALMWYDVTVTRVFSSNDPGQAGCTTKIKQSSPATRHGDAWVEWFYSFYSFLTSALDGVSGQHHAPAALYPRGKDPRYPLYRGLGGSQSRSGHRG